MRSQLVVLEVTIENADADTALDALWTGAPTAVQERPAGANRTTLIAGFVDRSAAGAAADALTGLDVDGMSTLQISEVTDQSFLDTWREHAQPMRVGRFVIAPGWLPGPSGVIDGAITIRLDPGHAFGSGSHPTTRLVLEAVDRLVTAGTTVLDVGCGSGVLAIAAALRGASVLAVDIDPAAFIATTANAALNDVTGRVSVSDAELASIDGAYGVVLANLLAPTIAELADALVARVGPGGRLVLSGLLADRWSATTDLFPAWRVDRVDVEDGWAAVTLIRRST